MRKGFSGVFIAVIAVVVLVAAAIIIAYVGSKQGSSPSAPSASLPSASSGIVTVGNILQNMVQSGSIIQQASTVKSSSAKSPSPTKPVVVPKTGKVIVNSVSPSGSSIVANVTTIPPQGNPVTTNLVFVHQGETWEVTSSSSNVSSSGEGDQNPAPSDTSTTPENANAPVTPGGTPSIPIAPSEAGPADLIVSGVTVSPDHPTVNDPAVQIVVTIKNIGGATSNSNDSFSATLSGLAGGDLIQRNLGSLGPNQSLILTFIPYKNNSSKMDDTPGEKTIQVTGLTGDNFTQSVAIY